MVTPKKLDKDKKKVGRKKWIPDIQKAEALAAVGLEDKQIAECMGIARGTIYIKFEEFPDFRDAVERGRAKGVGEIANSLFKSAKSGNMQAAIFFLKARGKWRETQDVAIESKTESHVSISQVTDPIEAARVYSEFIKKRD